MTRTPAHRAHPVPQRLAAFLRGRLPPTDAAAVSEHLRSPCLPCLLAGRGVVRDWAAAVGGDLAKALFKQKDESSPSRDALGNYAAWIEGKADLIKAEESAAPALMAELMLRPPAARREAVRSSQRYQLLALAEALRHESRREGFRDVARSLELAELAVEVADCLETSFYGVRLVCDARALGSAIVGNARRIGGDLFAAERALQSATTLLDRGTGDVTVEAETLSLLASLRTEQSRFLEAVKLLERTVEIYRDLDLQDLQARALLQLGRAAGHAEEHAKAVAILGEAVDLLGGSEESDLVLWARHNIALFLSAGGRYEEAASFLKEIRSQYDRFPDDRSTQTRRRWLEGRIHEGLGELDEAAAALREVRTIFAEEERAFDNALVTLDLAAVYLQMGDTAEVQRLAEEMYPVFRSQDVHRHAVAALILFKQAAATEVATVGLVRDLSRYLTRARNNPYLKYEPSEPAN